MGPKVRAACEFVKRTLGFAAIGSIDDAQALLEGSAGTCVSPGAGGLAAAGAQVETKGE
jgi:carbamate kinase